MTKLVLAVTTFDVGNTLPVFSREASTLPTTMAFVRQNHGISAQRTPPSPQSPQAEREASVGGQLRRYLGPEYVSYRKGEGGRMLAYAEGHEVIGLMNEIFGWNGWTSKVVSFVTDYAEAGNGGKWSVGVAATVRVTVKDTAGEVWHEDTGYGTMDNGPSRGKAMEKCRKEAVTDGLKRAARQFGNATGGCLYNNEYLERVKKVKGPAERIEFVEEELLRKPMNKRRRLMMEQERMQQGAGGDEFGEEMDDEMFADVMEREELIVT